jgi:hypothetical protein
LKLRIHFLKSLNPQILTIPFLRKSSYLSLPFPKRTTKNIPSSYISLKTSFKDFKEVKDFKDAGKILRGESLKPLPETT